MFAEWLQIAKRKRFLSGCDLDLAARAFAGWVSGSFIAGKDLLEFELADLSQDFYRRRDLRSALNILEFDDTLARFFDETRPGGLYQRRGLDALPPDLEEAIEFGSLRNTILDSYLSNPEINLDLAAEGLADWLARRVIPNKIAISKLELELIQSFYSARDIGSAATLLRHKYSSAVFFEASKPDGLLAKQTIPPLPPSLSSALRAGRLADVVEVDDYVPVLDEISLKK